MNTDPLTGDVRDTDFRKNFWIVLVVHAALIGALGGFAWWWKSAPPEQITWLDGGGEMGAPAAPEHVATPEPEKIKPEPVRPPPPKKDDPDELTPPAKPTPEPKKQTPKPTPQPTPKPITHTTPKPATPKPIAKVATPKPQNKTAPAPVKKPLHTAENAKGTGEKPGPQKLGTGNATQPGTKGGPGAPGGSLTASETNAYFRKIEQEFAIAWIQPLTVESTGGDLTAVVRIRVSPTGAILAATLEHGTGIPEVDDSIRGAFPRFRQIPPPPAPLLKDGVFSAPMDVVYKR